MSLIVPIPPANTARLRFVTTKNDFFSRLIRLNDSEGPVSHVEAVMADGTIIAALIKGGVQRLPGDYDKTSTLQILVDLPMTAEMYAHWAAFLEYRLGWKYDAKAIAGYALHNGGLHDPRKLICSASIVDSLRHCGWWARPLAQKYHAIDPLTVLLMVQADQRGIVHPTETTS
jgi:hypothetical protein